MKTVFKKITRFFKQVRGKYNSRIPTGMSEFDTWADSFMDTYDLPTTNRDSIRFTLASTILHLGPTDAYRPKQYFLRVIQTAAAKQIAGACFQDIKDKQKAAMLAAQQAEATAAKVSSDDAQQSQGT